VTRRRGPVSGLGLAVKVAPRCYFNVLGDGGTLLAYGATTGVPFQQRTGLPASSKP